MTSTVLALHTTEGTSIAGAEAAFKKNNSWPHRIFAPATDQRRQYVSYDSPARALRNMSGGVQTNNREEDGIQGPDIIQLEIVGFARDMPNLPDDQKIRLALEILTICREAGIPVEFNYPFAGNDAYGLTGSVRLTAWEWQGARGILGHQHVPENTHWDPGHVHWLPGLVNFFNTLSPQEATVTAPEIHYDVLEEAGPGKVRVAGWAYDPDQPEVTLEIHAHIVVDGVVRVVGIPAVPRPDVNAVGIPGTHGFDAVVDVLRQVPVSVTTFALDSQGGPASSGGTKSLVIWK